LLDFVRLRSALRRSLASKAFADAATAVRAERAMSAERIVFMVKP
jgi:hypothetical protein